MVIHSLSLLPLVLLILLVVLFLELFQVLVVVALGRFRDGQHRGHHGLAGHRLLEGLVS